MSPNESFDQDVTPLLRSLGVHVDHLRYVGPGDLRVDLQLPRHDWVLRAQVIEALVDWESTFDFDVIVDAALLFPDDDPP